MMAVGLFFLPSAVPGDEPVLISLSNGQLTWTNAGGLQMYAVEWNHDLLNPAWQRDWAAQQAVISTAATVSTHVPMTYRVARGFDEHALEGIWMAYHPEGYVHLKMDGHGVVNEFGATERSPVGYYTVQSNGAYQMTICDSDDLVLLNGQCLSSHTWSFVYQTFTGVFRKVAQPGALAGIWKGTISPYTNVILHIRSDGFIPVVSNLIDVTSGSAYVDDSNHVAMALFTGADRCMSDWARVDIRGLRINTTNILGDYDLDWDLGWITGVVHLQRQ